MMFQKSAALVITSALVLTATVHGQNAQPGQPARPAAQPQQPGQTQGYPQVTDQTIAACLAIANQEEVAIAQFVSEKTKNDDVKEFAKMLVEDHQAFLKKLQRFTPEARDSTLQETASTQQSAVKQAGGAAPQQSASGQQRSANPQQQQPGQPIQQTGAQGQARQQVNLIQLEREIAQECLSEAKKGLSEKEGAKFDACFIGHQIAKHEAMKTKLTVLQRHASSELAQLLADGVKTTEKHLKDAEKIMDDLVDVKDNKATKKTEK